MIAVNPDDCRLGATAHRAPEHADDDEYVDFFFTIDRWIGTQRSVSRPSALTWSGQTRSSYLLTSSTTSSAPSRHATKASLWCSPAGTRGLRRRTGLRALVAQTLLSHMLRSTGPLREREGAKSNIDQLWVRSIRNSR